jgi:hypothetical protein
MAAQMAADSLEAARPVTAKMAAEMAADSLYQ